MVDHEHRTNAAGTTNAPDTTDAPDTDQIPVQSAPPPTGRHQAPDEPTPIAAIKQVKRTRISGLWVGVTVAAVVLLVLLIFIIQNGQSVQISFIGGGLHLPLGVALLLAAICGVLLVAIPGYARIIQLRRAIRRANQR